MRYCVHYQFDEETNKYVSLVKRSVYGNRNPNKCHKYICKRCNVLLHDVDKQNLDNKIRDMNNRISDNDSPLIGLKSDIYDMLAPVPGCYDEDSKYRDDQRS